MIRSLTISLVGIALFVACNTPEASDEQDDIVAKVGDLELHRTEVEEKIASKLEGRDSAQVFDEFVLDWIKETVLVDKAHTSLSNSERDKSDLVSQYYNDLIIHELQEKLLSERLDTNILEANIEVYYNRNRKNFELKENIVRLRFFSIPQEIEKKEKLWKMFRAGGEKNLAALQRLCDLTKTNYFYQDSVWLSFNDVLKEVPITTYNQESYLNNNRFIRLNEKDFSYFIQILDFRVKDNISPLEFEKDRIKNIIIHKRKVELLQQIEDEIVREAYANNKIETF